MSRCLTILCIKDLHHLFRAYPAAPHIDQRPRKDPNHVIEKSVSRNMEFQQIFFLQKFQLTVDSRGVLPEASKDLKS